MSFPNDLPFIYASARCPRMHPPPRGEAPVSASRPVLRIQGWLVDRETMGFSPGKWIGLRENLQETMVFTIKYRAFL